VRHNRRESEAFSIAFLDVITCGFGAIILLLMIAKTGDSPVLEPSPDPLAGKVRDLQTQLFEIRGEAKILNRDLNAKHEQISVWDEKVAILQAQLERIMTRYKELSSKVTVNAVIEGQLEMALQSLTEEMRLLLAQKNKSDTSLVGGIPIDSQYIIFIIDTSGSMQSYHWERMINQLDAVLNIYPEVKGMQIMSDMGTYMISSKRRQWLVDNPALRRTLINTLRTWTPFSNSSPEEGITEAIRAFYDPNKKISIYVFGDEFSTTRTVRQVVQVVDHLNPKDANGNAMVRIHAVGFPAVPNAHAAYEYTNRRFATLMRELTYKNNGTFVGLN